MRVGFDLDGVLYNFGDSVLRYLASIGKNYTWKDGATESHNWNFFEHWGMSTDEFLQVCHDGVDAGYIFAGPAREGAAEAVGRVAAEGHEIIIITDRQFGCEPRSSHNATEFWLSEHGIEYDELWFSADKTCVPTDTFVEDKIENYDALVRANVNAFLINRPWNKEQDYRVRINDVSEYADLIVKYGEKMKPVTLLSKP